MNKKKFVIASLAMDLKRAALGFYNGSQNTAERFLDEALTRRTEVDEKNVERYICDLLDKLQDLSESKDKKRVAEDALMYSTIFQNYAFNNPRK